MKFILSSLCAVVAADNHNSLATSIADRLVNDQSFRDSITHSIQENLARHNETSFHSLTIADKLKSIAADLGTPEQLHSLWKHYKAAHPAQERSFPQFNINYNLEVGSIDVHSTAVDANGLPVLQWHMNKAGETNATVRENEEAQAAPAAEAKASSEPAAS